MKKYLSIVLLTYVSIGLLTPYKADAQSLSNVTLPCAQIEKDLRYAMPVDSDTKSQIIQLQNFLSANQFFSHSSTGNFGSLTRVAVKKFQIKHGIPSTGVVGPLTRNKINSLMGCKGSTEFFISAITGPNKLNVNEQGTWIVKLQHASGTVEQKVRWGDEEPATQTTQTSLTPKQTTSFTHVYTRPGVYVIAFHAVDALGVKSMKTQQVTVVNPNQPKITVATPNGGERWNINSVQNLTWNISNVNSKVDLFLWGNYPGDDCVVGSGLCPSAPYRPVYVLDKNIDGSKGYGWIAGTDIDNKLIPRGEYKVQVCEAGSVLNCDKSNAYFTLVDAQYENNQAPISRGISGPITLRVNEPGVWTVDAYDPEGEALIYTAGWVMYSAPNNQSAVMAMGNLSNPFKVAFTSVGEYVLTLTVYDKTGKGTEVKTKVSVTK